MLSAARAVCAIRGGVQAFSGFDQRLITTPHTRGPYRGLVTPQTIPALAKAPADKPQPEALTHLRPTDQHGAIVAGLVVTGTVVAVWLSLRGGLLAWVAGQLILGGLLVVWFAILHECGHRTLFRSRRLNAVVGLVAGFLAMIPFHAWTRVHGRHHKWTGWQDLDPTTASLVPRTLHWTERTIVNICWRCWIPLSRRCTASRTSGIRGASRCCSRTRRSMP